MSFPSVSSRADSQSTSNATSHTVNLGSTPSANDLLIVAAIADGTPTITWPTALGTWTQLYTLDNGTSSRGEVRYKRANGEGTSITLTTDVGERLAASAWVIGGSSAVGSPESGTATGSSTTPDPPSLSPSWGTKDTLWLAVAQHDAGDDTISGYPSSYTQTSESDSTGGTGGVILGRAERQVAAASENPGAFTFGASKSWVAATIAIKGPTPITATIGQVSDTSTAQPLSRLKVRTLGQVTETDLTQSMGRLKTAGIGQSEDTSVAQSLGRLKMRAIGQVEETDLAQAMLTGLVVSLGQVAETDLAHAMGRLKTAGIGQASEPDLAQAMGHVKTRAIGQAGETDIAVAVVAIGSAMWVVVLPPASTWIPVTPAATGWS